MRRVLIALAALTIGMGMLFLRSDREVLIHPGQDLQRALDEAPAGAVVRLEPGGYAGPIVISKPVDIRGPGATIESLGDAVVKVTAPATISGIATTGGSSGILIRETNGVVVEDVLVTGAATHGIEIVDAQAFVTGVEVVGLTQPFAQGIEIRNSDGRPDSRITHSRVIGGQEGIVAHVAELVIEENHVTGTTMRGIVVTEMSDGWVRGNTVENAAGVGLYCGDMSRCEFSGNSATGVVAGEGGRSSAGWGLVVHYHASASTDGDSLSGAAGASATFVSSRITERSPLEPGGGSRGIWPALPSVVAALAALGLIYGGAKRFIKLPEGRRRVGTAAATALTTAVVTGLVIQTFHMTEHALQLFRVKVDGIPSRGGIVGPVVEAEWIHFGYNTAVLVLIAVTYLARRAGWGPPGARRGDALLLAGGVFQGYHLFEHSLKLSQHLVSGRKVNPGLLGDWVDLVHLHFAVNLAVYLAFLGACIAYAIALRASAARSSSLGSPVAAT